MKAELERVCAKCGKPTPRLPNQWGTIPPRRLLDRLRRLARTFKERFVPVWVLVDMLIGVWVLATIVARYKGLAATMIRSVIEYLMVVVMGRSA